MKEKSFLQLDAYSHIKERILSGEFQPDTLYSETRLSAELGISRTPVREALQCLSQDGYITIVPSRGFRIRTLNSADMEQSIQVRCAIEGYCAYLLCKDIKSRKAQRLMRRLQELLEDMDHIMAESTLYTLEMWRKRPLLRRATASILRLGAIWL